MGVLIVVISLLVSLSLDRLFGVNTLIVSVDTHIYFEFCKLLMYCNLFFSTISVLVGKCNSWYENLARLTFLFAVMVI